MPHLPLSPSQSIEAALREVSETDPNVLQAIELVGFPPTRNRPPGFATLLRIIMGQQVSTASAEAINSRLETANLFDPVASALASDETLRSVGLSSAKARYARALAEADVADRHRLGLQPWLRRPCHSRAGDRHSYWRLRAQTPATFYCFFAGGCVLKGVATGNHS